MMYLFLDRLKLGRAGPGGSPAHLAPFVLGTPDSRKFHPPTLYRGTMDGVPENHVWDLGPEEVVSHCGGKGRRYSLQWREVLLLTARAGRAPGREWG